MIVVATEDFEVYHGVVNELRDRGVTFTTIEPGQPLPGGATLVVTDAETAPDFDVPVVVADPADPRGAVAEAIGLLRDEGGRTIVGIDPGERPGVAVLVGDSVVAAFHVPAGQAAEVVMDEVADAADPIVRIGDGARLVGARIVDDLGDVPVELVDETGTTPYLGTGARGMGDVLAAVNIARIEGEPIESRDVEPTAGEIQTIKNESRERSADNRTIDAALARRVAVGDLTLDEALDEHRGDEADDANDADAGDAAERDED
ncbi:MAG: hypothetical protein ABEJ31_00605 [Haloarculaceae archaeon]